MTTTTTTARRPAAALAAAAFVVLTAAPAAAYDPWSTETVPPTTAPPTTQAPPTTHAPTTRPPATQPTGPQAPNGTGAGRRIVYSNGRQRVWLVESNGAVVRTYAVSGRAGVPRRGTYRVFSKSASTQSGNGAVTMRWMTRFARGQRLAIGFHSIPRDRRGRPIQSHAALGSFRSAGCVRQSDADALALWNFAPVGTTVVVV